MNLILIHSQNWFKNFPPICSKHPFNANVAQVQCNECCIEMCVDSIRLRTSTRTRITNKYTSTRLCSVRGANFNDDVTLYYNISSSKLQRVKCFQFGTSQQAFSKLVIKSCVYVVRIVYVYMVNTTYTYVNWRRYR